MGVTGSVQHRVQHGAVWSAPSRMRTGQRKSGLAWRASVRRIATRCSQQLPTRPGSTGHGPSPDRPGVVRPGSPQHSSTCSARSSSARSSSTWSAPPGLTQPRSAPRPPQPHSPPGPEPGHQPKSPRRTLPQASPEPGTPRIPTYSRGLTEKSPNTETGSLPASPQRKSSPPNLRVSSWNSSRSRDPCTRNSTHTYPSGPPRPPSRTCAGPPHIPRSAPAPPLGSPLTRTPGDNHPRRRGP